MQRTIEVRLPADLLSAILSAHRVLDDRLAADLQASLEVVCDRIATPAPTAPPPRPRLSGARYVAEFLGVGVAAETLYEIFARIVDMTNEVAPEALERLAEMRARSRCFVARSPEEIHPGNRYLPTMQTESGWWISKNIGKEDLTRALRALSEASGLAYGSEVRFSGSRRATPILPPPDRNESYRHQSMPT